jgi:hypothetical protein
MESQEKPEGLKDELYRKVGRNMFMFQHMEQMLKFLVGNGRFNGNIYTLKARVEKQRADVNKKTLGQLVGNFLENTYSEFEDSGDRAESDLPHFSFDFRIQADEDYYDTRKTTLASIVAERNDLIHHLLPRYRFQSDEIFIECGKDLDEQYERLKPEIKNMEELVEAFIKGRKELAEYLQSDACTRDFKLADIRQNPIVIWLGQIARESCGEDGWALLSVAGKILKTERPEEVARCLKQCGVKTLKGIVLAAEIFELKEEPTGNGGIRLLYRLSPGWELSENKSTECDENKVRSFPVANNLR